MTIMIGQETNVVIDFELRQVLGFIAADVNVSKLLKHLSSIFAESGTLSRTAKSDKHTPPENGLL
jgi:hypothetical protein